MALIQSSELEPGMSLSADVQNLDGQVLFKAGMELSPRHIDILQMWGIPSVEIDSGAEEGGDDAMNLDDYPSEVVRRAERQVDERFKLVDSSHAAAGIMRKICVARKTKELFKDFQAA